MKLALSRQLSQRDKSILLILGLVVLLLLVYLIGVRPALNQLANLAQERAALEQTLTSLGQVHARQQKQEQQGKSVLSRVPVGENQASVFQLVNQLASKDKVTIVSVQLGGQGTASSPAASNGSIASTPSTGVNTGQQTSVGGALQSFQYDFSVSGSTSDLEAFFADLATAPRLMTVQLQSAVGTASGVTANFTLTAYYRNG